MKIGNGNEDLFSGDISHKTQRRRKLLVIEDLLEDFRISRQPDDGDNGE